MEPPRTTPRDPGGGAARQWLPDDGGDLGALCDQQGGDDSGLPRV